MCVNYTHIYVHTYTSASNRSGQYSAFPVSFGRVTTSGIFMSGSFVKPVHRKSTARIEGSTESCNNATIIFFLCRSLDLRRHCKSAEPRANAISSALMASTSTGTLSCPILTISRMTAIPLPSPCADPAPPLSRCAMRPYIALRIGRSVRSISLCRPRDMSSTLILFTCVRLRCTASTQPGIRFSLSPVLSRASSVSSDCVY